MYTCRATLVLSTNHQQRAVNDLRMDLERKALSADPMALPDWSTFTVSGPVECWGARGDICFSYTGAVRVRGNADRALSRA